MRTALKGGARAGGKEEEEADDKNCLEFSWAGVEGLSETHDLCATGPAFEGALKVGDRDIGRYGVTIALCSSALGSSNCW